MTLLELARELWPDPLPEGHVWSSPAGEADFYADKAEALGEALRALVLTESRQLAGHGPCRVTVFGPNWDRARCATHGEFLITVDALHKIRCPKDGRACAECDGTGYIPAGEGTVSHPCSFCDGTGVAPREGGAA